MCLYGGLFSLAGISGEFSVVIASFHVLHEASLTITTEDHHVKRIVTCL